MERKWNGFTIRVVRITPNGDGRHWYVETPDGRLRRFGRRDGAFGWIRSEVER